jgi:glycosyltransferase involved in cell wall biosynthesis
VTMTLRRRQGAGPHPGEDRSAAKRAVIVANVLPRWISDFNPVSTELADAGYDVTLFVSSPDPDASGWRSDAAVADARRALDPRVEVNYLSYSAVRIAPVAFVRNLLLALRLARRDRDTLFILWTSIPILTWGPALHLLGCRVVYFVTGLGPLFASTNRQAGRRALVRWVERRLFATDRCRVMVHNRDDQAFLCRTYGLPAGRVVVTGGCGVDPSQFPFSERAGGDDPPLVFSPLGAAARRPVRRGRGERVPIILVPVRLLRDKGVHDAAAASRRLADIGLDHQMWFTSNLDPSHPTALTAEDIERITGSTPTVRFLGYQDDLGDLYRRCDVVCVPSYFPEGLPTALLEAASIGRPIVTCDNVGGRDFVRDGIDGLVVPPRSPGRLASALEDMLTLPDEAERMRRSAHARFLENYTKQAMLDLTVQSIESLGFVMAGRSDVVDLVDRVEPIRSVG